MRVELFGIVRARAGEEAVELEAATLGDALARLAARCPGLVPEVIEGGRLASGFLVSLNGERFVERADLELEGSDTLLILGAQVGG